MRSVETMRAGGETRHRTGHTSRTHRHRTLSCCWCWAAATKR